MAASSPPSCPIGSGDCLLARPAIGPREDPRGPPLVGGAPLPRPPSAPHWPRAAPPRRPIGRRPLPSGRPAPVALRCPAWRRPRGRARGRGEERGRAGAGPGRRGWGSPWSRRSRPVPRPRASPSLSSARGTAGRAGPGGEARGGDILSWSRSQSRSPWRRHGANSRPGAGSTTGRTAGCSGRLRPPAAAASRTKTGQSALRDSHGQAGRARAPTSRTRCLCRRGQRSHRLPRLRSTRAHPSELLDEALGVGFL